MISYIEFFTPTHYNFIQIDRMGSGTHRRNIVERDHGRAYIQQDYAPLSILPRARDATEERPGPKWSLQPSEEVLRTNGQRVVVCETAPTTGQTRITKAGKSLRDRAAGFRGIRQSTGMHPNAQYSWVKHSMETTSTSEVSF